MPLEKGAKPGSEGFSKNVAAEVRAGKPAKQAVAIAYNEAKADTTRAEFDEIKRLLTKFFTEEAKEPEHKMDSIAPKDLVARVDALKARCDASGYGATGAFEKWQAAELAKKRAPTGSAEERDAIQDIKNYRALYKAACKAGK